MHYITQPRRLAPLVAAVALSFTVSACGGGDDAKPSEAAGQDGAAQGQPQAGDGVKGCGSIMDTIIELDVDTAEAEKKGNNLPAFKKAVDKAVPELKKLAGEVKDAGKLPGKINELAGELGKVKTATDGNAALKIVEGAKEKQQTEIAQLCGSA